MSHTTDAIAFKRDERRNTSIWRLRYQRPQQTLNKIGWRNLSTQVTEVQVGLRVRVSEICTRVILEYKYEYRALHLWGSSSPSPLPPAPSSTSFWSLVLGQLSRVGFVASQTRHDLSIVRFLRTTTMTVMMTILITIMRVDWPWLTKEFISDRSDRGSSGRGFPRLVFRRRHTVTVWTLRVLLTRRYDQVKRRFLLLRNVSAEQIITLNFKKNSSSQQTKIVAHVRLMCDFTVYSHFDYVCHFN